MQETLFFSDSPEKQYAATVRSEYVKKLGQFFTPFPIAHFMAKWVIAAHATAKTILDPAVGLGIFLRAILKENKIYQLLGYDIDTQVLQAAHSLFANNDTVKLLHSDYLFSDWDKRYDGIICNPPYQRFQNYPNRQQILAEFHKRLNITLSGLTNLHTLFLLKSMHQLSENGRAAYILPSEFLNADYGVLIKQQLIQYKSLQYVIVFDFKEKVFDNVITTACILLFDNCIYNQSVQFISIKSLNDLAIFEQHAVSALHSGEIAYNALDPNIKWRTYYQKQNANKYKNLVPLSQYGKIVRGIATGDNDYFTFNLQKQAKFHIHDEFLLPSLTKANQARAYFFTANDFATLKASGKNVYLLNVSDSNDFAIHNYLQLGETHGVHRKYLTSHRTLWYTLEKRPPAPILVTVFNRQGLRFVRNEANVRNLTCFHGFYLNSFALNKIDILMAYLMTEIARDIFNDNRREYGDGLKKFEPNDLNSAKVVDLKCISTKNSEIILTLFNRYRISVIENCPETMVLESLNALFSNLLLKSSLTTE